MPYDVVIVGGGPAGLSAALALGRACKRVLLCDAGVRRNAAAQGIHNFVTRDGIPPDEFRAIARQQLAAYPNVEIKNVRVESVSGSRPAFRVTAGDDVVETRRLLLCTGMIDQMLLLDGFPELWGHSIFQCPYCHGWEVRGRPWGYLAHEANAAHLLPFVLQLRGWTSDVIVFTSGDFAIPEDVGLRLTAAQVRVETTPATRLVAQEQHLQAVELADGRRVQREVLFAHPPQRQTDLIHALGVALDDHGMVIVDAMSRETSVPGIYASGDVTSRMQAALPSAALGMQAAAAINLDLSMEAPEAGFR